jgi:hypothetical protein
LLESCGRLLAVTCTTGVTAGRAAEAWRRFR